jgi:hypothetical protein
VGTEFDPALSSDNCGITSTTYELSGATVMAETAGASLEGVDFKDGTTTVTWRAYDAAANNTSCSFSILVEPTIIDAINQNEIPSNSDLLFQNYPNPFFSSTKIRYHLTVGSYVEVHVYDMLGRKVTTIVNENQIPGTYEYTWETQDTDPGIYFCELKTRQGIEIINLIMISD